MADAITTPAAAPTQEQLAQEYETHRTKVASIAPQIIVDRLTRVHGFRLDTEDEAQAVVKAAMDLFYMKQAGVLKMPGEPVESDNVLVKAAKEVSAVADKLRSQQAGDDRIYQAVLSDEELMKSAREVVRLSA